MRRLGQGEGIIVVVIIIVITPVIIVTVLSVAAIARIRIIVIIIVMIITIVVIIIAIIRIIIARDSDRAVGCPRRAPCSVPQPRPKMGSDQTLYTPVASAEVLERKSRLGRGEFHILLVSCFLGVIRGRRSASSQPEIKLN